MALGQVLAPYAKDIDACIINGRMRTDWKSYIPKKADKVNILSKGGLDPYSWANIIAQVVIAVATRLIMAAITPEAKKPKLDSKRGESFGIAGFTNTTGPGTPIYICYGTQRVHGHVIGSGADLSEDGYMMTGRVLYCLGDSGGDQYGSISDVQIDGISSDEFEGLVVHTRLGANDQTVIPEFENVDQLWAVNLQIPYNEETEVGTPILYTTHSNTVNRMTLFLSFPSGLWSVDSDGDLRDDFVLLRVEYAQTGGSYIECPGSPFRFVSKSQTQIFKKVIIDNLAAAEYGLRLTVIDQHKGQNKKAHSTLIYLFNVQETEFTAANYPGYVLLGVTGINAKQVTSLESMKCSALVEGKRVKVPQWGGGYLLQHTRQRCWIVRDMMTHPTCGMGNEIDESEIDDAQWHESQDYYDELVPGHEISPGVPGPTEVRDYCDVIINESRWDWEWVRSVAGEARGRIFPSGEMWKYVIDRPGTPNLLYTCPGNIAEDTLMMEISPPDRPFNQVIAEYRDAINDYEPDLSQPINDGTPTIIVQDALRYETLTRESQVMRENMIYIKKAKYEIRRWQFSSPMKMLVSEPMDIDWVAERVLGDEGAYGGILPPGSTATSILLAEPVTLDSGKTYDVIVHHQRDNTTEQREINTAAGTWLQVTVGSAFVEAPQEHDVIAIGEQNIDHVQTRAMDLELDDEGRIRQTRVEYVPLVYTADPLLPRIDRRRFPIGGALKPLPLRNANATELLVMNRDGSFRSVLHFDVTPGLSRHSGTVESANVTDIICSDEPMLDDYFNGNARITIHGQTKTIVNYIGAERRIVAESQWTVGILYHDTYEIEWTRFGNYAGFHLEQGETLTDAPGVPSGWTRIATYYGTHGEKDGGDQKASAWFRFIPFSNNLVENKTALWIKQLTLTGDSSAPAAPALVDITSYLKNVTVETYLNRPVAEDLAGIEILVWQFYQGSWVVIKTIRVGAPHDSETWGQMLIKHTVTLESVGYGGVITAHCRSVDYSDNPSAWTQAGESTTLSDVQTGDITPNAVTTISEYYNAGDIDVPSPAGYILLGWLLIQTTGGSVKLESKVMAQANLAGTETIEVYLRRGWEWTDTEIDVASGVPPINQRVTIINLRTDNVGAGVYPYTLWAKGSASYNWTVSRVWISAFEVKR